MKMLVWTPWRMMLGMGMGMGMLEMSDGALAASHSTLKHFAENLLKRPLLHPPLHNSLTDWRTTNKSLIRRT